MNNDDALKQAAEMLKAGTITATDLVATLERVRQIKTEGYDAPNDAKYTGGELAKASCAYMIEATPQLRGTHHPLTWWPWAAVHWKPKADKKSAVNDKQLPEDRLRCIQKSIALGLAEYERIDALIKG